MPLIRRSVQVGTTARLRMEVDTSDAEQNGKAGAFTLKEGIVSAGDVATDLSATMPVMVERAYPTDSGASTSVTGTPTYTAGGGPSGENVYDVPVSDSSGFTVGGYVRASGQPDGEGQVYEVLDKPDGTTVQVHCKSGGMDVVNGDTLEEVTPTGVYVGYLPFVVDTYMNASKPTGEVRLIVTTVATGDDPKFSTSSELVWTFDLELETSLRPFRAG